MINKLDWNPLWCTSLGDYFFLHNVEKTPAKYRLFSLTSICVKKIIMRKHYTPIGNIFKSYQLVWTNVENISGLMKSYQSMWNACTYPMRKHSTSIGNFSKLPNFPKIWASIPHQLVTFWNVTNWCGMLAHRVCASIPHRLVTFHWFYKILQLGWTFFSNVTNWCGMLVSISHQLVTFQNNIILP